MVLDSGSNPGSPMPRFSGSKLRFLPGFRERKWYSSVEMFGLRVSGMVASWTGRKIPTSLPVLRDWVQVLVLGPCCSLVLDLLALV